MQDMTSKIILGCVVTSVNAALESRNIDDVKVPKRDGATTKTCRAEERSASEFLRFRRPQ